MYVCTNQGAAFIQPRLNINDKSKRHSGDWGHGYGHEAWAWARITGRLIYDTRISKY